MVSKQKNRARTTSSTILGTLPNRTRRASTENWDFHRLEPYTKPWPGHLQNFGLGLGGKKPPKKKKTNSWERGFPGTFRTNVPLICLFSLSFQWEEVQKFPGTLFLGTFFSYFRWFFSLWGMAFAERAPNYFRKTENVTKLNLRSVNSHEAFLLACKWCTHHLW